MNDSGLFSFGLQTPIWDRRQIGPCKVDFTGTTFEVFQGAKGTAPEPFCSTGGYGSGGAAANAKPENPVSFIPVTE
jgi:hypothetical protein